MTPDQRKEFWSRVYEWNVATNSSNRSYREDSERRLEKCVDDLMSVAMSAGAEATGREVGKAVASGTRSDASPDEDGDCTVCGLPFEDTHVCPPGFLR